MANGTLTGGDPTGTEVTVTDQAVIILGGDFSGATVHLQIEGADSNWYPSNRQYADSDVDNLTIYVSSNFRLYAEDANDGTSIYWEIKTAS